MWQYRWGTWVILGVVALLIETSLLSRIFPPSDLPNLVLALTVSFAFFETPSRGAVLGGVMGLLVDLAAGRLIGLNLTLFALTGWAVATLQSRIVRDEVFVPGLVGAFCQVAVRIATWMILFIIGFRSPVTSLAAVLPVDILFGLFMTPGLIGILHLRPRHEVDDRLRV
jgi:rod shape-determining protein MreD